MLCPGMNILSTDEYLSYLPLAHIFERCMQWAMLWVGARVGFYSGNIKTLKYVTTDCILAAVDATAHSVGLCRRTLHRRATVHCEQQRSAAQTALGLGRP